MYSKEEIAQLNKKVEQNLDKFLAHFKINYPKINNSYQGKCPIHPLADNPTAFLLYNNQGRIKWKCCTRHCETRFKDTGIGLIRGLLSVGAASPSQIAEFKETLDFISTFQTDSLDASLAAQDLIKEDLIPPSTPLYLGDLKVSREVIRGRLRIPSDYFIKRGFSREILDLYDVGPSIIPHKKTYWREIVPIYEPNGQYCIGCTARTVFNKCPKCQCYHDENWRCPPDYCKRLYCKWKNISFKRRFSLYNYWHLPKRLDSVIIVESPGNVWKLVEAGISNVIAMYGCGRLTDFQEKLLRDKGVKHIFLAFDADQAGEEAFKQNGLLLWKKFNLHKLTPFQTNDFGEMTIKSINDYVKPQLIW